MNFKERILDSIFNYEKKKSFKKKFSILIFNYEKE